MFQAGMQSSVSRNDQNIIFFTRNVTEPWFLLFYMINCIFFRKLNKYWKEKQQETLFIDRSNNRRTKAGDRPVKTEIRLT